MQQLRRAGLDEFPAAGWRVHDVEPDLAIRVWREMPDLPASLDAEVDRLWTIAQERSGGGLFNGRVFSADRIEPHRLLGHWTEYRRVVAQMERHDLFDHLALRPSATGGVLACADGVVFGRRPDDAVYQAGLWQLPPAGSIDPASLRPDGTIDAVANLFKELAEELGLERAAIYETRLLCLAEHPGSHVLDLGILLRTSLGEAGLRDAHAARGNTEYAQLRVVRDAQLESALGEFASALTPQALAFLVAAGLIARSSWA